MTPLQSLLGQIYFETADELRRCVKSRLLPEIWSQYGEDIVQESFLRLMERKDIQERGQLPSLKDALSKVKPLLYGISYYVMQEIIRSFKREDHTGMELEVVAPSGNQFDEIARLLTIAKAHCSVEEWAVFEWIAFEDLESSVMGDRLDLTAGGARSKVYRSRSRIREALNRESM